MIIFLFFFNIFFLPVYKMHPRLSILFLAATNCVLYTEIYGKWFEQATAWHDIIVHLPLHTLERNGDPVGWWKPSSSSIPSVVMMTK